MRNRLRKSATSVVLAFALAISLALAAVTPAQAVLTRPGAKFGQYDVMLSSYETEQARRSFWAATVICWDSGLTGRILSLGVCQSMVSVCAAQAYYGKPRKRAGITFAPGTAWCWKY